MYKTPIKYSVTKYLNDGRRHMEIFSDWSNRINYNRDKSNYMQAATTYIRHIFRIKHFCNAFVISNKTLGAELCHHSPWYHLTYNIKKWMPGVIFMPTDPKFPKQICRKKGIKSFGWLLKKSGINYVVTMKGIKVCLKWIDWNGENRTTSKINRAERSFNAVNESSRTVNREALG